MLFREIIAKFTDIQNVHPIVFLPLFVAVLIVISSCATANGSIVISENPDQTGFTMSFKKMSSENKCNMSLVQGEIVQIEVVHETGEIAFSINGKKGSEPYTGKNLQSMIFTVTVSETDDYVFKITGKVATGRIIVKRVQ